MTLGTRFSRPLVPCSLCSKPSDPRNSSRPARPPREPAWTAGQGQQSLCSVARTGKAWVFSVTTVPPSPHTQWCHQRCRMGPHGWATSVVKPAHTPSTRSPPGHTGASQKRGLCAPPSRPPPSIMLPQSPLIPEVSVPDSDLPPLPLRESTPHSGSLSPGRRNPYRVRLAPGLGCPVATLSTGLPRPYSQDPSSRREAFPRPVPTRFLPPLSPAPPAPLTLLPSTVPLLSEAKDLLLWGPR